MRIASRHIVLLCVLHCWLISHSNVDTDNYVLTKTYTGETSFVTSIEYYDGLGRLYQTVDNNFYGNKSLVALKEYDLSGRDSVQWNPVALPGQNSAFASQTIQSAALQQYDDSHPFALTEYEPSPLGRPVSSTGAGEDWHVNNKSVRTEYLFNDNSTYHCVRYRIAADGVSFEISGTYAAGELDVVRTTDEDGKISDVFTDMYGQILLQRSYLGGNTVDTYYIYDSVGNLRYVLPPKASPDFTNANQTWNVQNSTTVQQLCYVYEYDGHNRCVSKKLPGAEPLLMRYDKDGRLVFTQDGNQRLKSVWSVNLKDIHGRDAISGTIAESDLIDISWRSVKVEPSQTEPWGYESETDLIDDMTVNLVNYYDNYDFIDKFTQVGHALDYVELEGYDEKYKYSFLDGNEQVDDVPELAAKGLLTGTAMRVLGDTTVLVRSVYYDHHGNAIQSHESNALGGAEHTYSHLSFTGKPLQVLHVHATADTVMSDIYSYTYDNMERLLTASVSHDGGMAVQLAQNTYNQLGQLYRQYLGMGIDGITFYSYNVRGWTTLVNNSNFRQTLHYQDTYGNATPCFNGNISAMEWSEKDAMMASTPTQHHYLYTYDGLSRLTAADYGATSEQEWNGSLVINGDNPARDYDCTYAYDLNGNITSLTRKGVRVALAPFEFTYWNYGTIDDLSLTYNGNQLKNAIDQSTNVYPYEGLMDFKDGANQRVEYTWDANGNMTMDTNKGITRIKYNVLNLPQEITYSDRHIVRYKYAADGRKLQTEYLMSMVPIIIRGEDAEAASDSDGSFFDDLGLRGPIGGGITPIDSLFIPAETTLMVRDYCGNHIYRDRVLERINNDYGYCANGNWYYYIKDYQGNVRAVINDAGTLKEVNNYYPYGALMGGGTVGNNQSVQPYKYGTKELDRQNGLDWYDSQARMYDPLLGRTPTMDPLSEKYYSISPYAWCGENPVLLSDPTGEEWIISTRTDQNGGVHVNIRVTGVVYNNSSEYFNMNAFRNAVASQIEDVFTFSDDVEKFDVTTTADIRVAKSVEDISERDHVFQIVDQNRLRPNELASTLPRSLDVNIGTILAKATINHLNSRSIAHELGHSGGLSDANEDNNDHVRLNTNLMTQISYLQKNNVKNPSHIKGLTPGQIRHILNNYPNKLNQNSPIYYNTKISFRIIPMKFTIPLFMIEMKKTKKIR